MNAKQFYNSVSGLYFDTDCTLISKYEWESLMAGARRANKKKVESLIKKHLPELYNDLALDYYNPYNCYRTDKHIIYVHSHIEYFLTFTK